MDEVKPKRLNLPTDYPGTIASYTVRDRVTGYYYIGSTVKLSKRLRDHRYELAKGIHYNRKLQLNYCSWDNYDIFFTLHDTIEQARAMEQENIDKHYNDPMCCNRCTGTTGFWGGIHGMAQDHRDRVRALTLGVKRSDAFREACRQRNLGKTLTPEHRAKISAGSKRHPMSDDNKRKLREANFGQPKVRTQETVDKWRKHWEAKGGFRQTEEARARIAATLSKRVSIDGVEFTSPAAVAAAFGLSVAAVRARILRKSARYRNWYYLE